LALISLYFAVIGWVQGTQGSAQGAALALASGQEPGSAGNAPNQSPDMPNLLKFTRIFWLGSSSRLGNGFDSANFSQQEFATEVTKIINEAVMTLPSWIVSDGMNFQLF
jgi:hypothetical protein